jgi:CrcB protein
VRTALLWGGVALLGGLGAVLRFLVDRAVTARTTGRVPVGTFVVNITGAVVLGLLAGAGVHGGALLLAGTAVAGSYTTFSTWMLESHRAGEDGRPMALALNLAGSLLAGLAAVWLGWAIGGWR